MHVFSSMDVRKPKRFRTLFLGTVAVSLLVGMAGCRHKCPKHAQAMYQEKFDAFLACVRPAFLAHMQKWQSRLVVADLPLVTDWNAAADGPKVGVNAKGIFAPLTFSDRPTKPENMLKDLKRRYGTWRFHAGRRRKQGGFPKDGAFLFVTRDAPASKVAEALKLLWDAEFRTISFLVKPAKLPECRPPLPGYYRRIRRPGKPEETAVKGTTQLEKLIKGCPAAVEAYARLGGIAPEKRAQQIRDTFPEALVKCHCKLDWKKILTLFYVLFYMDPKFVAGQYLSRIDPKAAGITVKADTPWKDIAPKVFASGGKPLWIHIEGASETPGASAAGTAPGAAGAKGPKNEAARAKGEPAGAAK